MESDELARQVRKLNENNLCLLQLIWDGYEVKIGPGTKKDVDGDTFTFSVTVTSNSKDVCRAEGHILDEVIADVYGSTPEPGQKE